MSVQVDGEYVDSPGGQGLLSTVGHTVSLRNDLALPRRYDVLPIGIYSHTQDTGIVVSALSDEFFGCVRWIGAMAHEQKNGGRGGKRRKKRKKDQDIVQHQHVVDIPDTGKHDLIRLDG